MNSVDGEFRELGFVFCVAPCCPGEEAAPGPLCELPGRGAEGGGSGRGRGEGLLCLGQGGSELQDAASAGHA